MDAPTPSPLGPFPAGVESNPTLFASADGAPAIPPGATVSVVPYLGPPTTPVVVQSNSYSEYAVSKIRYRKSGLALNPIQGPPGTPADVVRSTAPYGYMVVRWISKRRGAQPIIPSTDMQDANLVLLEDWVSDAIPGHFLDGTQFLVREGQYTYGLRVPYNESDTISIGAMPYTNEQTSMNTVGPESISKTIIGPNQPPAGAPTDPIDF